MSSTLPILHHLMIKLEGSFSFSEALIHHVTAFLNISLGNVEPY